ncbi:MAG: hypothetical protein AAF352_05940, partial [Pseudomonadota bacterium]
KPEFLTQLGITNLKSYFDAGWKYGKALSTRALPTSYFADRNGNILSYFVGPTNWNHPDIYRVIDHYLRSNSS